jgi:hypothetical protein
VTAFGDLPNRTVLVDTTGRIITGDVTIALRPGIGIQGPNGEHLEGGPHTVSVAFAAPLIASGRASVVAPKVEEPVKDETKDEVKPSPVAQVKGAPAGVQQRDPRPNRR